VLLPLLFSKSCLIISRKELGSFDSLQWFELAILNSALLIKLENIEKAVVTGSDEEGLIFIEGSR